MTKKDIQQLINENKPADVILHSMIVYLTNIGWTKDYVDLFLMKATLSTYENMVNSINETLNKIDK